MLALLLHQHLQNHKKRFKLRNIYQRPFWQFSEESKIFANLIYFPNFAVELLLQQYYKLSY